MARRNWPDNYMPMLEAGHGVWNVWYDHGPRTQASIVHFGASPHDFLRDDEAAAFARNLAERHPHRRYVVKLKKST